MKKTFREVIRDIKEGEVWECDKEVTYEIKTKSGTYLSMYKTLITSIEKEIRFNEGNCFNEVDRFKLIGEVSNFTDAFKAYEEGKMIQSVKTWRKYQKYDNKGFEIDEIRDKWLIRSEEWPNEVIKKE